MVYSLIILGVLVIAWMIRALQVNDRARRNVPPPWPPAEVVKFPTHGPWADHGPNCKCNVCR